VSSAFDVFVVIDQVHDAVAVNEDAHEDVNLNVEAR
jgi:hypothetical protein